jgi:hypothetical protein
MNLEVQHQIVFPNETKVHAKKSESTTRNGVPAILLCTRNGFVSGAKSGDNHDWMNGENFKYRMLTQLLPNFEEPTFNVMVRVPYHGILQEKPTTHSWRKDDINAWL